MKITTITNQIDRYLERYVVLVETYEQSPQQEREYLCGLVKDVYTSLAALSFITGKPQKNYNLLVKHLSLPEEKRKKKERHLSKRMNFVVNTSRDGQSCEIDNDSLAMSLENIINISNKKQDKRITYSEFKETLRAALKSKLAVYHRTFTQSITPAQTDDATLEEKAEQMSDSITYALQKAIKEKVMTERGVMCYSNLEISSAMLLLTGLLFFGIFEPTIILTNLLPAMQVKLAVVEETSNYNLAHTLFHKVMMPDTELGFKMQPNVDINITADKIVVNVKTDSAGFKRSDTPTQKGNSTIAVVGDSFAFCWGVQHGKCWTSLLEKISRKGVGNYGVNGYTLWQYNQFMSLSPELFRNKTILYLIYTNDYNPEDEEVAAEYYNKKGWDLFKEENPTVNDVISAKAQVNYRHFWEKSITYTLLKKLDVIGPKCESNEIRRGTASEENIRKVEGHLQTAIDLAASYGSILVPVVLRSKVLLYSIETYRDVCGNDYGYKDEEKLVNATVRYFEERGVKTLDLTGLTEREIRLGRPFFFKTDMHLTEEGNLTIAREIARFLEENELYLLKP